MADICLACLDYADEYYKGSTEAKQLELAVKPIDALYSTLPASEFGVQQFKVCRQW